MGDHLFGTSGIRGVVGEDLTADFCQNIARAAGSAHPRQSRICIATDTRISRETIKGAVISGLLSSGISVTDLGILPTPALAFLTQDLGFDTGIMITASHNPPEFNGIKLFNKNSLGYSRAQEGEIERIFHEKRFRADHSGTLSQQTGIKDRYFQFIQNKFPGKGSSHNLKLVVDPGNGAASGFAGELFSRMGFEVIPLNDEPDGTFPNRSPEPGEDTLKGTLEFLRQKEADLAICFDGDADRVVFCDREGFLGFGEMVAFISRLAVEKSGRRKVATTVETGKFLELVLADLGVEVVRGRVGDVNVAYLAQEIDAAIGVEEAGIYIMPDAGYYPEPFLATLTLLGEVKDAGEIRNFQKEVPKLFSGKRKIPCPNESREALMERIKKDTNSFGAKEVNMLDGLRFEFDDSWMLIRPSGTEPAIRVTAESTSSSKTEELLDKGIKAVEENLRRLVL